MFDLKAIRDNPEQFDAAMARRGLEAQTKPILSVDDSLRQIQTSLQKLQQERNEKSKQIGEIKKSGGDAQSAMDAVSTIKQQMEEFEQAERDKKTELKNILSALPNILNDQVPDGADEDDNVEVRQWGTPRVSKEEAKDHVDIGEALGLVDFEAAAKVAGARFTVLKGGIARLERAIAQFMLDTQTGQNGYTEVSPPLLVTSDVMYGTAQLPKFQDDQFETTDGRWLIPTSEVVLTNLVREEILDAETLPHRYTAFTPCFRKEAGSAGKDTRGMLRQHQFYKVEMVSITHPDESDAEHERMVKCAEGVLEALEIPYRTVVLCGGDTGFGARKTFDIEAWLPGQNTYREISSCSNCGDFQARRMNARFKSAGDKKTQFVHTLNGSGLAVGRTLIAVMENYYDPADGGIHIPEALKPYMGGLEKIVKG